LKGIETIVSAKFITPLLRSQLNDPNSLKGIETSQERFRFQGFGPRGFERHVRKSSGLISRDTGTETRNLQLATQDFER